MSGTTLHPIGVVVFLYLQLSYTVTIKGFVKKLVANVI